MNWFIAIPVAWAVVAVVLGLVIGNGIRIERGIEPEQTVGKVTAGTNRVAVGTVAVSQAAGSMAGRDGATVAQVGNALVPVPADAVGSSADEVWPAARARQASLTGAR